jgi:hypothetical protein
LATAGLPITHWSPRYSPFLRLFTRSMCSMCRGVVILCIIGLDILALLARFSWFRLFFISWIHLCKKNDPLVPRQAEPFSSVSLWWCKTSKSSTLKFTVVFNSFRRKHCHEQTGQIAKWSS